MNTDPDPRPRVYSEKCSTCVFRTGNPMHLNEGRLADLVEQNLASGSLLVCHKTTYGQATHEVACRGYFDAYGDRTNVVRVMDRLARLNGLPSGFQEVDPETPR